MMMTTTMKDRAYTEGHSVWNSNSALKSTGGLWLWVTAELALSNQHEDIFTNNKELQNYQPE